MAITLNHTIVPAHDKEVSAQFFANIFGLKYEGSGDGHFAPVRVNETLTLTSTLMDDFDIHHLPSCQRPGVDIDFEGKEAESHTEATSAS